MKAIGALTALILVLGLVVLAQDTATMSAPVIKTNVEEIQFTVDCGDFEAGGDYRLGFGSVDGVEEAQLELLEDGNAVEAELVSFNQDHTQTWWGMPQLKMRGFFLQSAPAGQTLKLRVKVPRSVADTLPAVYLGLARDYGGGLWYLEDGAQVKKELW